MRRQIALAAAFVLLVLVAGLPARQTPSSPQQQPPVFRTGAAFVRVDVYPTKNGRIVPGLKREDFQLFEDGKPQKIESFDYVDFPTFASEEERRDPATKEEGDAMAADPRNRVFVIYLDRFHIKLEEAHYARSPLISLLDRTIGPSDVFSVMTPQQTYASLVFGRKVQGTEDMLTRHWAWNDTTDPVLDEPARWLQACFDGEMDEGAVKALMQRSRLDQTLGGLRELVDYLGRLRQERKNLFIFTHGWDLTGPADSLMKSKDTPRVPLPGLGRGRSLNNSPGAEFARITAACDTERMRLASIDFRDRFRELLEAAKRANVSFYPVNPAGLSADPAVMLKDVALRGNGIATAGDHLRELAANTDGLAVVDTNDLRGAMMKITDSLSAYYLLGYTPTNSRQDGSVRMISVKGPSGLDLKSRRQYRAANENDNMKDRAAAATRASTAPTPARDLDAAFATLARGAASRSEITASAVMATATEVVLVAEASRAASTDTDVQLIVNDAAGNTVGSGRAKLVTGARAVSIRATIASGSTGPWQAVMRSTGGDARGGDTIPLVKPAGIVGDAVVVRVDGGASPVAIPIFTRRERLRSTWTTMAASELTRSEARVLDRRGAVLPLDATVTTNAVGSKTAVSADVTLASLAPGDYLLELVVAADGVSTRRLLAFRVTQ